MLPKMFCNVKSYFETDFGYGFDQWLIFLFLVTGQSSIRAKTLGKGKGSVLETANNHIANSLVLRRLC